MPYGSWVNDLPTGFFLAVHIAPFALGAGFAWLAFKRELALLGAAFSLFAAAELVYMTYHFDWTVFLFAHTIAEALDLAAFVLVCAGAVYSVVRRPALGVVVKHSTSHRFLLPAAVVPVATMVATGRGGTGTSEPVATTKGMDGTVVVT
jgi:hypothetical protein